MSIAAVLDGAGMGGMRRGQQLPLAPAGSVAVAPGVDLLEVAEGGVVFVWGRATWCWEPGDATARRLAAVQLVETRSARHGEVAVGFGTDADTLRSWRGAYGHGGAEALRPAKRGPKGPSKLTEDALGEIRRLRGLGASMDDVAAAVGVSRNSVSRALAGDGRTSAGGGCDEADAGAALEPLARPEPRTEEREAARCGELAEAAPVICEGASLPLVGALVILPALVATGLLEVAEEVYGRARASFYGLRSLVLSVVFAALLGEPRAEGVTRIDPVDAGRLLGLDRAPEVKTIRRRIERLAAEHKADWLLAGLARRHAGAHAEAMGVLY
ncbi:MAG: putative transposase, partial [Acidimicrobiales bacterium]